MSRAPDGVVEDTGSSRGTAEVTRAVGASAAEVWEALTDPNAVRRWFGALSSPLNVGEMSTLSLGDGDFFLIEVLQADSPHTLKYVWASLGIGLEEAITWHITPDGDGCLVRVTDYESERTREATFQRRKYWLEMTSRLESYLNCGNPGPDYCREFVTSIEIAGAIEGVWGVLLEPTSKARWLRLRGSVLEDGAYLTVEDGGESAELQVTDVITDSREHRLCFRLTHQDWLRPTSCDMDLRPRRNGVALTICHQGWEAISFDNDYRKRQRARFCKFWLNALRRLTLEYVRRRDLPSISPNEVKARLGQPGFFVFDTNAFSKWERGHIAGATYIGPDPFTPDLLPPDKDATLVFYCFNPT